MKKYILLVICILFGLNFMNAGLNKFFNYMPAPENLPEDTMKIMAAFMEIKWIIPLVGVAEIIGGLLFIIPRLRALGAIVIFPVVVGICVHHITVAPSGLVLALIILVINLWVIIENFDRYLPIIRSCP